MNATRTTVVSRPGINFLHKTAKQTEIMASQNNEIMKLSFDGKSDVLQFLSLVAIQAVRLEYPKAKLYQAAVAKNILRAAKFEGAACPEEDEGKATELAAFEKFLTDNYRKEDNAFRAARDLWSIKQQSGELVRDFKIRILALAEEGGMVGTMKADNNAMLIKVFVNGLRPNLQDAGRRLEKLPWAELVKGIAKVEEEIGTAAPAVSSMISQPAQSLPLDVQYQAASRAKSQKGKPRMSAQRGAPSKADVICDHCGRNHHIKECRDYAAAKKRREFARRGGMAVRQLDVFSDVDPSLSESDRA